MLAKDFKTYKVRKGGTLKAVARKYRLKPKVLADLNNISLKKNLAKNQHVKLPFRADQSVRDPMYSDLYELPRGRTRRRRKYRARINVGLRKGRRISSPSKYYKVQKGDTLWHVARKTGVSLNTIIKSNSRIVGSRQIRAGDRLVVE